MKTLLVYAKNYGKFPKNFIHNILWGCFYESCVAFHRNYTDRKQYIFREKTAHQAATDLNFEQAAELRDKMSELKKNLADAEK